MKLATLLLLIGLLQVSARGFSQITLNEKNAPVKEVLNEIKKQTGYYFFYNDNVLKDDRITINVTNVTLEQALSRCFEDLPYTFQILEKNVVITAKRQQSQEKMSVNFTDTITVKGRVVDKDGNPLPGATVIIRDEKLETITNANGQFALYKIKKGNVVITISFVGFLTKTIKADADLKRITLETTSQQLDETRVIAYGTESRRFSVGSTASVSAKDIENQPVPNVLLALQGQVPGLSVNATSGIPGASVKIQIRGQNTLASSRFGTSPFDQPLFIIDGVPFATQNNNIDKIGSFVNSNTISSGYTAFNSISPDDIESVSILKDADATSIYGSQGANGVIIITTKKGKPGATTLNIVANSGYNTIARPIQMLNTQQYLKFRNEAFKNDGLTPGGTPGSANFAPDLTIFDQQKYTNYYKTIFDNRSNTTDLHATLSGGSANTTFLISTGYSKANFDFPGKFGDNRLTLHSAFHHTSPDSRFTIDFGTDYGYVNSNSLFRSQATQDIFLPPNLPSIVDPSGNLVWNYRGVNLARYQFYAYLKQPANLEDYNLNESLHVSYKLFSGLTIGANLGYSRNNSTQHVENPLVSQPPSLGFSSAQFSNNTVQTINIEPQLDYNHTFGRGRFSAVVGSTYKKNMANADIRSGYGYSSDAFLGSINGASSTVTSDSFSIYKYIGVFGRVRYVYDQKYVVNLTARRDGSSNFGPGRQFGNFGSAGLGWIFSEEKGFKSVLSWMSYAKISGNYGTAGSDGIAGYQYQAFYKPIAYIPTFQGVKPVEPQNLYNPDYSWGLKKSLNLAIDLGLFQDRILLNGTYFISREGNQLLNSPVASITGFSSVLENLGATVQNSGWEFTLTSAIIKTKDFSWTTNFNITANRNKLIAFPGLANSPYASLYVIGMPTSEVFGYRYKGVNPSTGVFEFYTANGQTTYNPDYSLASKGGDRVPIANTVPKFYGGFGNNINYKRFSLSVFFQFSKQTAPNYLSTLYNSYVPGYMTNVPIQAFNNRWTGPGSNAQLEKLTSNSDSDASNGAFNFTTSSGAFSDDTYLRLKTVSLSYSLPESFLKKVKLNNCKFYANCQNLLTITNYKVGDPEQPGGLDVFPVQRTLVFGFTSNF